MFSLVLVRHGESEWNRENRFSGWTDIDLTEKGCQEARQAGRALLEAGLTFDVTCTSLLRRAIRTLWLIQEEMELFWLPVYKTWRLNERHYGSLQGLNKAETAARYGEEQVKLWRRSYTVKPPPLAREDPRWPGRDRCYADLTPEQLPLSESLLDTFNRLLPCWDQMIAPALRSGSRVLVVAHGNSLRALAKYLEGLSEQQVLDFNIPTGIPLVYELNEALQPVGRHYLGDPAALAAAEKAVADQGRSV